MTIIDKEGSHLKPCPWCSHRPWMKDWVTGYGKIIKTDLVVECINNTCPVKPRVEGVTAELKWDNRTIL